MTTAPRILIAGIGNIFLGDDAFGVEVAQRLARRNLGEGVRVVDFGIRGIDLTYALLDGWDVAILVDAVPRGQAPGTVYLIELRIDEHGLADESMPTLEMHNLDPAKVLRIVRSQGSQLGRVLLVGCEPTPIDSEIEMRMNLSPGALLAVEKAIQMIESLVQQILGSAAEVDIVTESVS